MGGVIDTHVHLDMLADKGVDVDEAIERALGGGLEGMLAIGGAGQLGDASYTLSLARSHSQIRVAAGIHPHQSDGVDDGVLERLRSTVDDPAVVAVGEMGLDYYYNFSSKKGQRSAFAAQIKLARAVNKPIIVHTRAADEETFAMLDGEGANEVGGVIHCFSARQRLAEQVLEMGFYLSFSGIVTFPNAKEVADVAAWAPADRVLAETDAPYLSPVPHRGKINEPVRVVHVVERLAVLRQISFEEAAALTTENARRCFGFQAPIIQEDFQNGL